MQTPYSGTPRMTLLVPSSYLAPFCTSSRADRVDDAVQVARERREIGVEPAIAHQHVRSGLDDPPARIRPLLTNVDRLRHCAILSRAQGTADEVSPSAWHLRQIRVGSAMVTARRPSDYVGYALA